jgi:hypothetical protein
MRLQDLLGSINYRVVVRILDAVYHSVGAEDTQSHSAEHAVEPPSQTIAPVALQQTPPPPEHEARVRNRERRARTSLLLQWLTFAAVVAYALVSCGQWLLMQRTLAASQENFRTDERAWVAPLQACIEAPQARVLLSGEGCAAYTGKGPAIFRVLYKNYGKTFAANVSTWIATSSILSEMQTPKEDSRTRGQLAPGEILGAATTPPIQSSALIELSPYPIYVYGELWYDDVFGYSHWTQFCYTHYSNEGNAFGPCPLGNTRDGDETSGGAQK